MFETVTYYQPKFILLNGPPYSGKSTLARELAHALQRHGFIVASDSFAAPMKHFIAVALGMKYQEMPKDSPRAELAGYSVREFLIDLSESYIKPRYGDGAFGRWFYHRIGRADPKPHFVIADDSGFLPEADALGRDKFIIRVTRPGKDFSKDSRGYLENPNYEFSNDGSVDQLVAKVPLLILAIKEFVGYAK